VSASLQRAFGLGIALALALPLSGPSVAFAAPFVAAPLAPAEGTLVGVEVTGLKRIEEAAVLAVVGLRIGQEVTAAAVRRDVKAIYETGFVDDVRAELSPSETGTGVVLRFEIDEKPAIREVKLSGNKKLDEDALFEVIDIVPFSVLNEAELKRNIRRMRDKYVEKGFYLAEIEPVVREVGDELVELTFEVTENRKVLVQKVEITGNEELKDRKIKRFLQTKEAGIVPWLTSSGTFDEVALADDTQIVRQVFLEEGYVDVQVDQPQVFLSPDKRFIHVSINVTEGPRYKLGKIKVDGDFVEAEGLTKPALREIISGATAKTLNGRWKAARKEVGEDAPLPEGWEKGRKTVLRFDPTHPAMETGDWFKLSTLQQTMQEMSDLYGDQGYAFANVAPNTITDPETGVVDIDFQVQRGDKVRIGRIDIQGNDPTFDKVIRREIPINEGEIYSGSAINEGRQRLDRLGYFEEVRISTPRGAAPDELDLKVEVTEQPTGSFSVGAGFSNIENFMLTLAVSKNNFLGLGYVMSANVQVSRLRQQYNLQFFDPYFLDSRWTLSLNGYSISRQFIEDEYQRGGSISVGRYLDRRDDVRMSFDYTFEDTGLNNIDSYKQRMLGGQMYRNGITSTGGLSLIVDKRNNRIQATRGIFTTASMALSGGWRTDEDTVTQMFGGDFNFLEGKFNLRAYQPLVEKEWLIFKYNGTLGRVWSTDGSILPFIHRYRAGGINSVRGYNWFSLGPQIRASGYKTPEQSTFQGSEDPTSAEDRLIIGGTETWINNFELEVPIIRQAGVSTVVFFDAGNAFGDAWGNGHINLAELRTSYGFGVRWFSPMGPLRFEWGFPTNPREDERRSVFDFSIGSFF
jgi:outer membrane protein insertion porin family